MNADEKLRWRFAREDEILALRIAGIITPIEAEAERQLLDSAMAAGQPVIPLHGPHPGYARVGERLIAGQLLCGACWSGQLASKPTPRWMNRWVCDACGKAVSR